jgi:DNA helicase-2/ATP-dependent DNA helicase PcrA
MPDILDSLNPAQREAVLAADGPCLVLAGAGSGKTRILTQRIAWLVQERTVLPWNVTAVTFTNKAAGEMGERVAATLGDAAMRDLHLGTFHALCVRILRREAERAGYEPGFLIYDTPEQLQVLRRAMRELDLSEKTFPPRSLLWRISQEKNRLSTAERFATRAQESPPERAVAKLWPRYQELLKDANAFDFDDLIQTVVTLLETDTEVRDRYQERTRHLLVDEYQDTNHAQYRLVKALAGRHRNLFVVGDEDQSIFAWRGADLRNILDFERDFPDAKVFRLEQNYRSSSRILRAALSVVSRNVSRKGKKLWTENPEGEPLALFLAADEEDEADRVVRRIEEERTAGTPLDRMAVMYRTHAQSRPIEDALLRARVPYLVLGGIRFYQRREIKDLLAYMTLAVSPGDPAAFDRVLNVPTRGIGDRTRQAVEALVRERGLSLWEALEAAVRGEAGLRKRAVTALDGFRRIVEELRGRADATPRELLEEAIERTGYDDEIAKEAPHEAEARRENIQELLSATEEAGARGETVPDFLAGLALHSDADDLDGERGIPLMTLHTAKGLEFDVVFLVGMEEGLLPHINAIFEEDEGKRRDELEEERRLCYVGMTRARQRLHLSRAERRATRGQVRPLAPSRFLRDIPQELLQVEVSPYAEGTSAAPEGTPWETSGPHPVLPERRARAAGAWAERRPRTPKREAPAAKSSRTRSKSGFQPGDKVRHPDYGAGIVLQVDPVKGDEKLAVFFPGRGQKKFLAKFAKLERILAG